MGFSKQSITYSQDEDSDFVYHYDDDKSDQASVHQKQDNKDTKPAPKQKHRSRLLGKPTNPFDKEL